MCVCEREREKRRTERRRASARPQVRFMNSKTEVDVIDLGVLSPGEVQQQQLFSGEVGFLSGSIKAVTDARVGDTITLAREQADEALPGAPNPNLSPSLL